MSVHVCALCVLGAHLAKLPMQLGAKEGVIHVRDFLAASPCCTSPTSPPSCNSGYTHTYTHALSGNTRPNHHALLDMLSDGLNADTLIAHMRPCAHVQMRGHTKAALACSQMCVSAYSHEHTLTPDQAALKCMLMRCRWYAASAGCSWRCAMPPPTALEPCPAC